MSEKTAGTLAAVAAVLVLSPDALLISSIRADAWTLVFWRGLLTAITLSVALVTVHGRGAFSEGVKIGLPGILVGLFFGASTVSFVMSVRLTTAANTLVIVASMPLFAAILTKVFLGERVPVHTWMAVATGFGGIAVVFAGSMTGGSPLGDGLALITAVFMASNFVIIRGNRRVSMIPAVVLSGFFTTVLTAFLANPLTLKTEDSFLFT